jgi:hypothetical protein
LVAGHRKNYDRERRNARLLDVFDPSGLLIEDRGPEVVVGIIGIGIGHGLIGGIDFDIATAEAEILLEVGIDGGYRCPRFVSSR